MKVGDTVWVCEQNQEDKGYSDRFGLSEPDEPRQIKLVEVCPGPPATVRGLGLGFYDNYKNAESDDDELDDDQNNTYVTYQSRAYLTEEVALAAYEEAVVHFIDRLSAALDVWRENLRNLQRNRESRS